MTDIVDELAKVIYATETLHDEPGIVAGDAQRMAQAVVDSGLVVSAGRLADAMVDRDDARAALERVREGRDIEQVMIRNAVAKLNEIRDMAHEFQDEHSTIILDILDGGGDDG